MYSVALLRRPQFLRSVLSRPSLEEFFDWTPNVFQPGYVTILELHPHTKTTATEPRKCDQSARDSMKEEEPKKYEMAVQLRGFEPKDIKVKVEGRTLTVEAKREHIEESGGLYTRSLKEITRTFQLPEEVDKENLKSSLTSSGVLELEAPLKIPIETESTSKDDMSKNDIGTPPDEANTDTSTPPAIASTSADGTEPKDVNSVDQESQGK